MVTTNIHAFLTPPLTPFKSYSSMWTQQEMRKQVEDALKSLLAKNKQEIEAAHSCLDIVYNDKITELIFSVAKTLSLSSEIKYQAVEIYQSFISSYLDSCVASCSKEDLSTDKVLKQKARKIKEEATPKALACVLIASKLTSNKSLFTTTMVSSLSWLKLHPRDICKHEIQILKHLEFRCCKISPVLEYIGAAVSIAGLWHGSSEPFTNKVKGLNMKCLSAECVQETAVELSDFVYLNREQVYEKLCCSLTGQTPRRTSQFHSRAGWRTAGRA
ncbi:uncharacterized protein LOC123503678 isoform X2 [Portunus trituberculatus]|uniref:uncharacterized protein LOC123503678 isoform X2 n=1 Tax=Portunus trituberculatus TaxID=210409 RepID=UPI001E1CC307|nr:uncharacterized protein LOC123503678 isoform X2 [Portunus trituberculatus]